METEAVRPPGDEQQPARREPPQQLEIIVEANKLVADYLAEQGQLLRSSHVLAAIQAIKYLIAQARRPPPVEPT